MSLNAKYVRYPASRVNNDSAEKPRRMTRKERREMIANFQVSRLIFNCFMSWFIIVMFLTASFMGDFLTALYPNTYAGLQDAAEIILANPDATDQLPTGYWIDENKTTERILCLRAWDGSWMTWSWSASPHWNELQHHSGWFFPVTLALSTLIIGVVLGILVTKFVPLKYSILWHFSETY